MLLRCVTRGWIEVVEAVLLGEPCSAFSEEQCHTTMPGSTTAMGGGGGGGKTTTTTTTTSSSSSSAVADSEHTGGGGRGGLDGTTHDENFDAERRQRAREARALVSAHDKYLAAAATVLHGHEEDTPLQPQKQTKQPSQQQPYARRSPSQPPRGGSGASSTVARATSATSQPAPPPAALSSISVSTSQSSCAAVPLNAAAISANAAGTGATSVAPTRNSLALLWCGTIDGASKWSSMSGTAIFEPRRNESAGVAAAEPDGGPRPSTKLWLKPTKVPARCDRPSPPPPPESASVVKNPGLSASRSTAEPQQPCCNGGEVVH